MPPRLFKATSRSPNITRSITAQKFQHICYRCSICRNLNSQLDPSKPNILRSPSRSHTTDTKLKQSPRSSRTHLRDALFQLQKHASSYINQSRLQLALRGLDQRNGEETIRIAILGVAGKTNSLKKSKELARLLVADPLKSKEEWEQALQEQCSQPVMLKISSKIPQGTLKENGMVQVLSISSPLLHKHNLEILVLESDPSIHELRGESLTEALLVPNVKIPTSYTGRHTQFTMPVHKVLIVSEDLLGAAMILRYPANFFDREIIATAVDLKISNDQKSTASCQFVDIALATQSLDSFRRSIDNSLLYEKGWFASGIPEILDWLKTETSTESKLREPLKNLIFSLIHNASKAIEIDQARQVTQALSRNASQAEISKLGQELQRWTFQAHTELRDQLEIAFNSRRWRKLSWWKLFWRVDDVSMIASDILSQRFLINAEQEAIFLAGRVKERVNCRSLDESHRKSWAWESVDYEAPKARFGAGPRQPQLEDFVPPSEDISLLIMKQQPWPRDIRLTRFYLTQKTVPSLQALAQRLVFQTLSASSLATAFSALIYMSSISIDVYEAGVIAAFSIVYSLKRFQNKWELARKFWEGEVKEEGRKAIRSIEGSVSGIITAELPILEDEETQRAKSAIRAAQDALDSCT